MDYGARMRRVSSDVLCTAGTMVLDLVNFDEIISKSADMWSEAIVMFALFNWTTEILLGELTADNQSFR